MMPGVLELTKDMLEGNVRVAIPNYIGVREPRYTVSIGLIHFAHKNGRVQGKEIAAAFSSAEQVPEEAKAAPVAKRSKRKETETVQDEKKESKMKSWFKTFFD